MNNKTKNIIGVINVNMSSNYKIMNNSNVSLFYIGPKCKNEFIEVITNENNPKLFVPFN